jgi:hypothetical protein
MMRAIENAIRKLQDEIAHRRLANALMEAAVAGRVFSSYATKGCFPEFDEIRYTGPSYTECRDAEMRGEDIREFHRKSRKSHFEIGTRTLQERIEMLNEILTGVPTTHGGDR